MGGYPKALFGAWVVGLSFLLCVSVPMASDGVMVSGLTEPIHDVTLSSEVGGKLEMIAIREGEPVKKGGTILELNKRFEELDVKRSRVVWESKAEVRSALDRAETLKTLFESTRELYLKTGSVSKEELNKRELEYKLAFAEYQRLKVGEEKEGIEFEMARAKVSKLILKSPISGTVTGLFLEVGETCEPRQPLAQVVDTSQCILVCNMEAHLGTLLKKGQKVSMQVLTGGESLEVVGRITFVSPVVDPASGLMTVKAIFDNPQGRVRPGVSGSMMVPAP